MVEVLSKSTRDYDRGTKFLQYRSLPSFKEYILVDQEAAKIEIWSRLEENIWKVNMVEGLKAKLYLSSVDCEIGMADIYYLIDNV